VDVWDGSPSDVQRYFVNTTKATYPVLTRGSRVGSQYGLDRSTFVIVDHEGLISYISVGQIDRRYNETALASNIQTLLQRAANTPPRITSLIPNQMGVGTQPIVMDLSAFGADAEDSASVLKWRAEGVDGGLISVSGQDSDGRMLTFTPAPGAVGRDFLIKLVLSDTRGAMAEQAVTLRWTPAPALSASAERLDFGSVPLGAAQELKLTVSNTAAPGGLDLQVRLAINSSLFTVSDTSVTVPAGGRRDIIVVFRPSSSGSAAQELTLLTNDPARGTLRVPLTGTGAVPPGGDVAQSASDFDGNGEVGFDDFFLFAAAFGGRDARFDLDKSGAVDFSDFFLFAADFGKKARK
jgi:hypothetical protein